MVKMSLGIIVGIACIVALMQPDVLNAVVAFLFVGVIPGTSYRLPFWATMLIATISALMLIASLFRQSLLIGEQRVIPAETEASNAQTKNTKKSVKHYSKLYSSFKKLLSKKYYRPAHTASS